VNRRYYLLVLLAAVTCTVHMCLHSSG